LTVLVLASLNTVVLADPADPGAANPAPVQTPGAATPATPQAPAAPPAAPTQEANPPAVTAPALPATPPGILLRLKFKKGEAFVYRMTTTISGTMSFSGRVIPMNSSTSMVVVETVKGVRPDGAARLGIAMKNMTVSANGKQMPMNDKLKAMMSGNSTVMDTRGNMVDMDLNSTNPMAGLMGSGGPAGGLSSFGFPEAPVHVGDTWDKPMTLAALGLSATNTYYVANAWMQNGKHFVALHSSASGTISRPPSSSVPLTMSGPMTTTSDTVFDATTGVARQVKALSTTHISMTMSMPSQNGGPATPQSMSNDMTTSVTMQLVRIEQH